MANCPHFREDDIVFEKNYPIIDFNYSHQCLFVYHKDGRVININKDDLIKYVRVHEFLFMKDEIITALWDRVQVAVKLIGSPSNDK